MAPTSTMFFTEEGIRDQATVRRQYMTANGIGVASVSLLADRRARAPQSSHQFDRAASDLLSVQMRLSILCYSQTWLPKRHRRSHSCVKAHSLFLCGNLWSFFKMKSQLTSFMWLTPDLQVKSVYVPTDKALCPRWSRRLWTIWTTRIHTLWRKFSRWTEIVQKGKFVNRTGFSEQPRPQAETGI